MTQEFLCGFYGLKHLECEGVIKPERFGVNDQYKLGIMGHCLKCGEQEVVTMIPLRYLNICARNLRQKKIVPIVAINEFNLKDRSDLHSMGISLPDDQKLLL